MLAIVQCSNDSLHSFQKYKNCAIFDLNHVANLTKFSAHLEVLISGAQKKAISQNANKLLRLQIKNKIAYVFVSLQ